MPLWQQYYLAKSIPDALDALTQAPGTARIIAGGTDLLLEIGQYRQPEVHILVDVTDIPELKRLEIRGNELFIGATLALTKIVNAPLIQEHAQALCEACGLIGGPQVRNTATLGGNVAHALPAADGTIALLALGAQVEIASRIGSRRIPLQEAFRGPGISTLDPIQEMLSGFYLPLKQVHQASAFRRVMRPQGVALPILNLAVWLQREFDHIANVRISIGPAGPVPMRALAAEEILKGRPLSAEIILYAQTVLCDELHFRTSPQRASAEFRRHLSGQLFEDTLMTAWERARNARR